jgi:hypothetical protein
VSAAARGLARGLVSAGALAALVAFAAFVHHGIGPSRGRSPEWWQPRGFLLRWSFLDPVTDELGIALAAFGLPALLLAALVWSATRSAVTRTVAVWAVLGVLICVYYGLEAAGIWRFFHWRGSAVIWLFALTVAVTLVSPWLAASWERRPWPLRLALYLPVAFLALGFMRNATGTDQSLQFAISPWPVVPFFGLELVAPVLCFALACVALARAALGARLPRSGLAAASALAFAAALGLAWLAVSREVSLDWKVPALVSCIAAAVLGWSASPLRGDAAAAPGRAAALGALLVAAPILLGLLWVEDDYRITRDERAARINEALQAHLEREDQYPDRLDDLVAAGLLPRIPEPRVGFALIDRPQFVYQNFGINYLLEFSAPRWVQCAYNPPYLDEEDGEEEEFEDEEVPGEEDGDGLPGSWSCPARPPELW